ncbi:peptidase MA family metallohydrolase [Candidatus Omnitrophota bacterium]
MIKINFKLIFLFLIGAFVFCYSWAVLAESWQEVRGEHFIVFYGKNRRYAKRTLEKAEGYYKKIASDLAYARYSNFWQWDNRVKIYIYPDKAAFKAFLASQGHPHWAVGMANYREKEISSFADSEKFLNEVLPHELTHLIFRDYVGMENIPMWIDEGVAQWEESGKRQMVKRKMKLLLKSYSPIEIERLSTISIDRVKNDAIVELFYVQAISIIDFLITEFGSENFIFFCRQLRDGKDMDEALRFAYPTSIRDVKTLERKWSAYVKGEKWE